jgi:hypothetical protein
MRHDWGRYVLPGQVALMHGTMRKCNNCGKTQERVATTNWGRVVGYNWYPKAGRCGVNT